VRAKFMREVASLGLPPGPGEAALVTPHDLEGLPEPAERYFRFMGVVGKPRDWSFRLALEGRFRRTPAEAWMRCRAWQYNSSLSVARIFHLKLSLGGLLPVVGRDTYLQGRGRMLIRLFDLFTVGDGAGEAYDLGELVTYLNDAVAIAPSMLLGPAVSFSPVGANAFGVALADSGHLARATVSVDGRGAPTNFESSDRFCADPKDPRKVTRARWSTPVGGWQEIAGRRLFGRGQAVWHLDEGEFAYADFTPLPATLAFNVRPGT